MPKPRTKRTSAAGNPPATKNRKTSAAQQATKQQNLQAPLTPAPAADQPPLSTPEATPSPGTDGPTCQPQWQALHEAVVGLAHRNANPPLPCQDAALSTAEPRPVLLVADGAGSSAVSEIGAQTVVTACSRLLQTLDRQLTDLLDKPASEEAPQTARHFALLVVKHAIGVLEDLAALHRRPLIDFRCTLLMVLVGRQHALWLKVGDGALVCERQSQQTDGSLMVQLCTLGSPGKGEFANSTRFLDGQLSPLEVQSGLLEMEGISGLAAMSDGAAEKLIALDGSQVARQLGHWLQALREGQLKRRDLTRSFYSEAFCTGTTGDDCSLALLACTPPAPVSPG